MNFDSDSVLVTPANLRRGSQVSGPVLHFVVEQHTVIIQDVSAWKGICWDVQSPPVVLQGTMMACSYVDSILTMVALPILLTCPGAIYQLGNACPYTA